MKKNQKIINFFNTGTGVFATAENGAVYWLQIPATGNPFLTQIEVISNLPEKKKIKKTKSTLTIKKAKKNGK